VIWQKNIIKGEIFNLSGSAFLKDLFVIKEGYLLTGKKRISREEEEKGCKMNYFLSGLSAKPKFLRLTK